MKSAASPASTILQGHVDLSTMYKQLKINSKKIKLVCVLQNFVFLRYIWLKNLLRFLCQITPKCQYFEKHFLHNFKMCIFKVVEIHHQYEH